MPEAPRVAEAPAKSWLHFDNLFRILSLTIGGTGLVMSLILGRDKLFTTQEERQAMQREAIRLELVERERIETELAEKKRIEDQRLEQERIAKEAEARKQEEERLALLKEKETEPKAATKKKRSKKDPIGNFLRKTFK